MTQFARARLPRPSWLAVVLVLVATSILASIWLTNTIDDRERERFSNSSRKYLDDLSDRIRGLEVIAAVVPIAMSPELGGLSVEAVQMMMPGSVTDTVPAPDVMGAFAGFPLDGLAGFGFLEVGDEITSIQLSELPGAGDEIFLSPAGRQAVRQAADSGIPTTSDPILDGDRTVYVLAMPIRDSSMVAVAGVDARILLLPGRGTTRRALDVTAVDEVAQLHLTGASLEVADLVRVEEVDLVGRKLILTITPTEAFDLQAGTPAGFSVFALGMVISILVFVVGVMNRRRSEHQAEQLRLARQINEEKDRFIAAVSHELRTPLTAIVGISNELVDQVADLSSSEVRELIGMVANQSSEMSCLVEDLLVAARVDSGTITVQPDVIELGEQARLVCAGLEGRRGAAEIVGKDTVWVRADGLRVRQIIRNLVSNAHRHGGPNVTITVTAGENEGIIEVSDDGPGVDEHSRELIFAPYYRAGHTNGLAPSVGLGLSVARELAVLMEGELVYVDGPMSTFRLTLPLAQIGVVPAG